MSIGKIQSGLPPVAPVASPEASAPSTAGATFKTVQRDLEAARNESAKPVEQTALSPLERLRSGQIQPSEYADLKVNEATDHLQGLSPHELTSIKAILKARLSTDPGLIDLFKQVAGAQLPDNEGD